MFTRISRQLIPAVAVMIVAVPASWAVTTIAEGTANGTAVSARGLVTAGPNALTITLVNTTPTTHDSGQLLTGFQFDLPTGVSINGLGAAEANPRIVAANGAFTEALPASLLDINGKPTWEITQIGAHRWQIDFLPDTTYGLLGPATNGTYAAADTSIRGSALNPFADEFATFLVFAPGATVFTNADNTVYLFGTDFSTAIPGVTPGSGTPPTPVPEASVLALLSSGLVALSLRRRMR